MQSLDDTLQKELHDMPIPAHSADLVQRIITASTLVAAGTAQTAESPTPTIMHLNPKKRMIWGAAIAACLMLALGIASWNSTTLSPPDTMVMGVDMLADVDFDEEQVFAGLDF